MFKFGEQLQVGKRFGSRYMLELILVSTHLDLHDMQHNGIASDTEINLDHPKVNVRTG